MAPRDPVTPGKPSLGKLLQQTRVAHNRTQKQVERDVEIDRSRLSAYENDRERMSVATLEKLAAAVGLELPWEPGSGPEGVKKSFLQLGVYLLERWSSPRCLLLPPLPGTSFRWIRI